MSAMEIDSDGEAGGQVQRSIFRRWLRELIRGLIGSGLKDGHAFFSHPDSQFFPFMRGVLGWILSKLADFGNRVEFGLYGLTEWGL